MGKTDVVCFITNSINIIKNIQEISSIHCQVEVEENDDQEQMFKVFQKPVLV